MKAIVIEEFGGPEKLHLKEMPKPEPKAGEVLIQVAYAGVNPVDWKTREGHLQSRLPHEFPLILGWDVSGTVAQCGKDVNNLKTGDAVFAYIRKPIAKEGSYAEYVTFDANNVAKKPSNLSFAESAALPLVSLTAWQSLFDAAHLSAGETVLILGGSGGVGSMAIQFAKVKGARVLTTASPAKHDYVRKLGSDVALDYKTDFVAIAQGVDLVFDCVGGDIFHKSLSSLKKGGRIVSILERLDPEEAKRRELKGFYVFVSPSGENLTTIAHLFEEGRLICPHLEELPLEQAALAQDKLEKGQVLGKIVLKVAAT